jgi:phosphate transport system substrate-binding protein
VVAILGAVAAIVAVSVTGLANASEARRTGGGLSGAGSSFVFPLVSQWGAAYKASSLTYNPIGSGGGIAAITNRNVDFGASDAPLSPDQFRACKGCVQIPWALSATAIAYNLKGVKNNLHINGRVLSAIYMGQITRWNDARLKRLNKGVNLPDQKITVAYRSDNSGTSYNFTDYLAKVSPEWQRRFGRGVTVNWPTGVGGRGSSGVAGIVSRTEGAIGYFDVAYALKNHLQFFAVQNRSGKYGSPGLRGIASAAASDTTVGTNNEMSIVNPPKRFKNAYPICTYTYVIVPLKTSKAADIRRFLTWAVTNGQSYGPRLLFSPLPKHVRQASLKTIKRIRA